MNRLLIAILIFSLSFLAGCQPTSAAPVIQAAKPAANSIDDIIRAGQSVVSRYGDDLANSALKARQNPGLQQVDDYAETVARFKSDILSTKNLGDDVDDVARAQAATYTDILDAYQGAAPRTISNTPFEQWTNVQRDVYNQVLSRLDLTQEDAKAFMKTACQVFEYGKLYGELPPEDYTQLSILLAMIEDKSEPPYMGYVELADKVLRFAAATIEASGEATLKDGAAIMVDGLCLIAD